MSDNRDNLEQIDLLSISASAEETARGYLLSLGDKSVGLHDLILEEFEPSLYKIVMEHCKYNQSRAANVLGVSRGTLRTKLKRYFDDRYIGTRG